MKPIMSKWAALSLAVYLVSRHWWSGEIAINGEAIQAKARCLGVAPLPALLVTLASLCWHWRTGTFTLTITLHSNRS